MYTIEKRVIVGSGKRGVPAFGTLVSKEIFKNQNVSFSNGKCSKSLYLLTNARLTGIE